MVTATAIITGTVMTMTDTTVGLRLLTWLSPVFPTGGFAYSAGLEQAVADRIVDDPASLLSWLSSGLRHGSAWNDAVLFAAAYGAAHDRNALDEIAGLAVALANGAERLRETLAQGRSFMEAAGPWLGDTVSLSIDDIPLPVAVGAACGLSGIPLRDALPVWLHAFVQNQLQCAIRLSVTGQRGAASLLHDLEDDITAAADRACRSSLGDLGTCMFLADIAALNHETLQPRLFLS